MNRWPGARSSAPVHCRRPYHGTARRRSAELAAEVAAGEPRLARQVGDGEGLGGVPVGQVLRPQQVSGGWYHDGQHGPWAPADASGRPADAGHEALDAAPADLDAGHG